ncbi:MAG: cyclic nucleotide-binding domain-containing protein [Chthoniobacterales bacterium]
MSNTRDFFGFCTTLTRIELKALGELSVVQHIPAGTTIYSAGDPGDTLCIISRGMVEVVLEQANHALPSTYLSRGDIFGDLELLSNLPRTHSVRARDDISLRIFHGRDLDNLMRRVPPFFRYLSERLASRLLHARDLAIAGSHCRELSGSLSQFDLVTIYQTITNSSQTGELSIRDQRGKLLGAFWFEEGGPRSGQFLHLAGEEAFVQLFLEANVRGTFSFDSAAVPLAEATEQPIIARNPQELLLSSMQQRDELEALKQELSDPDMMLRQASPSINVEEIDPDLLPVVKKLWRLTLARAVSLDSLYRHAGVCEMKIYRAVDELLRTSHFEVAPQLLAQEVA